MVCSKSLSRTKEDDFNRQIASHLKKEDFVGAECALVTLNYVEEHASEFLPKIVATAPIATTTISPTQIVRSWVRFNHLLLGKSHAKERSMVSAAKSFGIKGYIVYGTPGLVCAQGDGDDVTSFLAECRNKIGKKPDVVTTDEITSSDTGGSDGGAKAGLIEIPMNQLEDLLIEQGLGDQRRQILGVV
jgi:hypothetical protein